MKKRCAMVVWCALVMFGCGSGAVQDQGSAPADTPPPQARPPQNPAAVEVDYNAGLPAWFAHSKTPDKIELRFDEHKNGLRDEGGEEYRTETKNKLTLYKKLEGEARTFTIMNYTIAKRTAPETDDGESPKGDPEWERAGRAEHSLCRVDGTWTLEGDTLVLTQTSRWKTFNVLGTSGDPLGPPERTDHEEVIPAEYRLTENAEGITLKKQGEAGAGFEATYAFIF